MAIWTVAAIVSVLALGAGALQLAINRNGPAVLSAVDRLVGGERDAQLLATISTGEHPAQKLIVWGTQDRETARPVLVFTHGGSWRKGDPSDYGFVGRAFVPEGFIVVLVGYRLVGEDGTGGTWPAMLEDTASAVRWTHEEIAQYGGDPDRIVLAGHSAGAYNVVMAAMDSRWLGREGKSPDIIAGVVGLSGPYDFFPFDSDSTIAAFGKAKEPLGTQVQTHLRGDAPPMLLIHGEKDELVGLHNSRDLAAQIASKGGVASLTTYAEMAHNDPLISFAAPWRNNRDVLEKVAGFALEVTSD